MIVERGPLIFTEKGPLVETCASAGQGGADFGRGSGSVFEAPAFVACLDDVAMMREAIEQGRGHLGIAEDAWPFAEGEIGGDEDRSALVEPADEMEEQLAAGLSEGEIAEFVEDDEVEAGEMIGDAALPVRAGLGLELIDEIDGGEEPSPRSGPDAGSRHGNRQMGLAGSRSANQHSVTLLGKEGARGEIAHQSLVDGRVLEGEAADVQEIESVIDEINVALAVRGGLGVGEARQSSVVDPAEFAIEIGGLHVHAGERCNGARILGRPVEAGPGQELNAAIVDASSHAKGVELDFMHPLRPRGRFLNGLGKLRRDELRKRSVAARRARLDALRGGTLDHTRHDANLL
jgi:hypothetical protein